MGVMSLVVMIQRFYKNVLGDEGYLTLTLPVNVHEILWSKLIVSFVWFLATGLIAIASVQRVPSVSCWASCTPTMP